MLVAALQLAEGGSAADDLAALTVGVADAVSSGAELIAVPCLPRLADDPAGLANVRELVRAVAGDATVVLPCAGIARGGGSAVNEESSSAPAGYGSLAVLCGDEALDPEVLGGLAVEGPDVLVWQVEGESALQVEAVREYAIAVSETVSSLVLVASRIGPEGVAAGGSVIVFAGDVLAEAGDAPAVLLASVITPLLPPESPGEAPPAPPLLVERLAAHRGTKAPVDYLADMD